MKPLDEEIVSMKHSIDAHTKKLDAFLKKKPKRDRLARIGRRKRELQHHADRS